MVPFSFTPDWLLSPPPNSPYLTKQENVTQLSSLDNILYKLYNFSSIDDRIEYENFQEYISHDQPKRIKEAKEHVKKIQQQLQDEKLKLL